MMIASFVTARQSLKRILPFLLNPYSLLLTAWSYIMKCPFCAHQESKVVDSRLSGEGANIRRRRECENCAKRYTTYERIEEFSPLIVKKDGRREEYNRDKLIVGISKACEKRPISVETINAISDRIEKSLLEMDRPEVESTYLGERVMFELHDLDEVAYVRFASVYRSFKDINEFMDELKEVLSRKSS